ncbi:MAG: hypothetical protein JWM22_346 [Frankiales bacterium]|jgi:hypothetical protein|nr:hypothetical protein [Frankiales bacterium]
MRVILRAVVLSASLTAFAARSTAMAARNPSGSGQPGASCQDVQATPTSPLLVNGFTTAGFAKAGSVYAGSDGTASLAHAQSPNAVSQYDVACYQLSQR